MAKVLRITHDGITTIYRANCFGHFKPIHKYTFIWETAIIPGMEYGGRRAAIPQWDSKIIRIKVFHKIL